MNKTKKLFVIVFTVFTVKCITDVIFQWIFTSMDVREHIWGSFYRSLGYIWLDFILHFWIYILIVFLCYLILYYVEKIKRYQVFLFITLLNMILLLNKHKYQFPLKQDYFPDGYSINYKLIKDFIVFTVTTGAMLHFIKHVLPNRKSKT